MKNKKGFTLVEILVVLTLLVALTTTTLLSMENIRKNSGEKRLKELYSEIELATDIYLVNHGEVAEKLLNGESTSECVKIYKLINEGLLRNNLTNPVDGDPIPANLCVTVYISDGAVVSDFSL